MLSSPEPTSVIEHHHWIQQFGVESLRPSNASQRNTQLSITTNNSTYQTLQLPQETRGLMPTLSGPRQPHSSWGGGTAGAWGRGTRRAPWGPDGVGITQPLLGLQVGGGRDYGCVTTPSTAMLMYMCRCTEAQKHRYRIEAKEKQKKPQQKSAALVYPWQAFVITFGLLSPHCLILHCPLTQPPL